MRPFNRRARLALPVAALAALLALPAAAAEISGRVTNGTTGQPVPGQFINLLALRGQMVPVREAETDAEGRFRFVVAANPNERFLVQVPYRGVMYSRPALFATGGKVTVDLEVFEADARPQDVQVDAHTIALQPHRGHVRVNEFFLVKNTSTPPRTYADDAGTFRFTLPGVVGDLQVSAGRAGGAPLRQQPQPLEEQNSFALTYAFKPGDTEVQISYAVPMVGATIDLNLPLTYQAPRRHVAIPREGVTLIGNGLTEIQQTQAPNIRVYSASAAEAPGTLALQLEADPAALEAAEASSPPAAGQASSGESQVKIVPHPVNRARWYIVTLVLMVLSFGLYYLYSLQLAPTKANVASSQTGSQPARGSGADS
jgi:hypothetical protein